MKVINLDKIVTKQDRAVILNGKKHFLHVPTVKDYIDQMKRAEEISKLGEGSTLDDANKVFDLTIDTLLRSFPTIKRAELEKLRMDQLTALRGLAEDFANEDAPEGDEGEGEAEGETE